MNQRIVSHGRSSARALAAALACLLIAACSGGSSGKVASTAPQSLPAGEVDAIIALLEEGKDGAAKKRIAAGLKKKPNDPALMVLRDSITRSPKELLGPDSYRYTVRPGDTMAGLAQRFLGNRLKFYQLSRYNGLDRPAALQAGQVLNIPGRLAPTPAPAAAERPRAPAHPARPRAQATATAPAAPARLAANPAAALQARSAGLAALNAGQPARAVTLLSRAARLDPGNAMIARDLARARRISATVGSK